MGEEEFINLHHSTVLRALIEEKNLLGALMIESPVYVLAFYSSESFVIQTTK